MSVPQRSLPDLRVAMAESDTSVEAIIPGETRRARGTIAMIENAVDPTTGMATVRASMPNEDKLLWPGGQFAGSMVQRRSKTSEAVSHLQPSAASSSLACARGLVG